MGNILRKNPDRDYALTLSWRFAEVEFLGLPNLKDERVFRLEHIYVPLRLRDFAGRLDGQETIYVPKALQEQRHLIVLGGPGSGKSTLVKVLTYAFGESGSNPYKRSCGELIPIPIILRDYATRRWTSSQDMLYDFIATLDESIQREISPDWLLQRLRAGRAILLIDGLDEIGSLEDRRRLRDDIVFPLLRESRESYVLLTSRIVGYEEVPFDFISAEPGKLKQISHPQTPPLNRFYVAPFNDEEISQFVTRWYQLREPFPDRQRAGVESLLRALKKNYRIERLAHNPLLLTLMALVHRVTANLPSGRVELYDKIVEAFLETIQVYRKLGTPAKLDEMKRWLAEVGWRLQMGHEWISDKDENIVVSSRELKGWLVEAIEKERGKAEAVELTDNFLNYVSKRSGLLVEQGPDKYAFEHLSFQEYFAAFHLRGRVRQFERLAETCADLATKAKWHETLNLLFEMLAEFPGAGDDLRNEIAARIENKPEAHGAAAQLFSALLFDEQSGLSIVGQQQAAEFVLDRVGDRYNEGAIRDLQGMSPERRSQLVYPWFSRRLQDTSYRKYFFANGAELVQDWPAQLNRWIAGPTYHRPTVLQAIQIALIGAQDEKVYYEMVDWAAENLPLTIWLKRINRSFGQGHGLTLADVYRHALYSPHKDSASSLLLFEMSVALAITKSQILKATLAILAHVLTRENGPYDGFYLGRYLGFVRGTEAARVLVTLLTRATPRVLARDLARDVARDLAEDSSPQAERALIDLLVREAGAMEPPPFESTLGDERRRVLVAAEGALFVSHARTKNLSAELHELLRAPDDWSRLLASSALLVLSEGGPELCRQRNVLVSKGLKQNSRFTFPSEMHLLTQKDEFTQQMPELFDLAFHQSPRGPWLEPDFFNPSHPASRFFLSTPSEFLSLVAEVLDPKGETELAKPWKK